MAVAVLVHGTIDFEQVLAKTAVPVDDVCGAEGRDHLHGLISTVNTGLLFPHCMR